MKKLLLLLFLIPVIALGQEGKIINANDIMEIDGTFYFKVDMTLVTDKLNMTLVTGKVNERYENGELKKEGTFLDGKPKGLIRQWYENGELKSEGTFKNGKLEGLNRQWYENGQLQIEGTMKDGEPDGVLKTYHKNGQLVVEITFLDGKPKGLIRQWHENGQLKAEGTFKNGKKVGVYKEWNKDGKLIKEAFPKTTKCYVEGEIPTLVNKFNYSGHKYQYMKKQVSWDVAKQLAEKEGGYLAVFETLEEMNHVIAASGEKSTYWIGLSDSQKEGKWIWINGKTLNKNMEGYLERGNDLKNRDYGHAMLQGGLMSRHISGGLPEGWKGQMCVSGYLIEFDSIN